MKTFYMEFSILAPDSKINAPRLLNDTNAPVSLNENPASFENGKFAFVSKPAPL